MAFNLTALALSAGLFAALFVALEIGYRLGRRSMRGDDSAPPAMVGAVQGATLGLLGLLLGFSFAGAAQRFMDRQQLILQEANALGTAYLRADLLPEPHRANLRRELAAYLEFRKEHSVGFTGVISEADAKWIENSQNAIWKAAREGVAASPSQTLAVLNPVNDVLDLHATRVAAANRHFPIPLLTLLVVAAIVSIAIIGYGAGLNQKRMLPLTGALAFLIAAALWIGIDLDHPRAGLIRVNDGALTSLHLPQD